MHILLHQPCYGWQRHLPIAYHSYIRLHILVYLRHVNVEMNHLRLLSVAVKTSCHTVAEAHTNGNKHVTLVLHDIWSVAAVHAEHAHVERMVAW